MDGRTYPDLNSAPAPVKRQLDRGRIKPVWLRDGGWQSTFRIERPRLPPLFLKVDHDLGREVERLAWLTGRLPVAEVREYVTGPEGLDWLLLTGLPGIPASQCRGDLASHAIEVLAATLDALATLPVEECPFDSSTDRMLREAERRVAAGLVRQVQDPDRGHWYPADAALEDLLDARPASTGPVVIHGDYCLPNLLVGPEGATGILDVGDLGGGDPWVDYTACLYSGRRNLGDGWDARRFFELCQVEMDRVRIRWFRLLAELL